MTGIHSRSLPAARPHPSPQTPPRPAAPPLPSGPEGPATRPASPRPRPSPSAPPLPSASRRPRPFPRPRGPRAHPFSLPPRPSAPAPPPRAAPPLSAGAASPGQLLLSLRPRPSWPPRTSAPPLHRFPMFLRARLATRTPFLRTLRPAPLAAMSTGTFVVSQPLNYRGGARVNPADASGTEKAFEPATGNGTESGRQDLGGGRRAAGGGRRGRAGGRRRGLGTGWRCPAPLVEVFYCSEPAFSALGKCLLGIGE